MNRRIVLPVLALSAVALFASASSAEARLFHRWARNSCCQPVVCAPVVYEACCDPCWDPCARPGLLSRLHARLHARHCCPPVCADPCFAPAPCTPVQACEPVAVCEPVCPPVCYDPCCRPRLIDRLRARLHARHCCPPVSCCDVPVCGC